MKKKKCMNKSPYPFHPLEMYKSIPARLRGRTVMQSDIFLRATPNRPNRTDYYFKFQSTPHRTLSWLNSSNQTLNHHYPNPRRHLSKFVTRHVGTARWTRKKHADMSTLSPRWQRKPAPFKGFSLSGPIGLMRNNLVRLKVHSIIL